MAARRYIRVGLVAVVVVLLAALLPIIGASREHAREIRLVARDMTFYLEGQDQPNPTLKVRAGERVKLVLRNEDEGMQHDFNVRGWAVATDIIDGKGEESVTFRVPELRGPQIYSCTPHPSSMRGAIEIE